MSRKLVKQNLRKMAALVAALLLVVPGTAMAQSAAGAQALVQIIGHHQQQCRHQRRHLTEILFD